MERKGPPDSIRPDIEKNPYLSPLLEIDREHWDRSSALMSKMYSHVLKEGLAKMIGTQGDTNIWVGSGPTKEGYNRFKLMTYHHEDDVKNAVASYAKLIRTLREEFGKHFTFSKIQGKKIIGIPNNLKRPVMTYGFQFTSRIPYMKGFKEDYEPEI